MGMAILKNRRTGFKPFFVPAVEELATPVRLLTGDINSPTQYNKKYNCIQVTGISNLIFSL